MAFAFIQSQHSLASSTTTNVVTPSAALTQNNVAIVTIRTTTAIVVNSVTDNVGNTYDKASGPITMSTGYMYQFYGVQVIGGAATITVTFAATTSSRVVVDEFSGGALTNAAIFDKATSSGSTGSSATVTSFSPTAVGELVVGSIGWSAAVTSQTAGTNYTLAQAQIVIATQYRLSATTSETAPISWSTSTIYAYLVGAYIPLSNTILSTEQIEFTYNSAGNVSVTPGTASLILTAFAPTVSTTANQTVIPGKLSLTLTTFIPSVNTTAHQTVIPGKATLVTNTFAPIVTITSAQSVVPSTASLVLTTFAPTATATTNVLVTPGTASLIITRYAPQVNLGIILGVASLVITTYAPDVTSTSSKFDVRTAPYGGIEREQIILTITEDKPMIADSRQTDGTGF